jgi:hypothetical protein
MVRVSSIRAAIFIGSLAAFAGSLPGVAAASTGCPNEQLRAEAHSMQLPDCRAYELVTPAFKEGVTVGPPIVSADGLRMFSASLGVFAGSEYSTAGGIGTEVPVNGEYEFARGETGWLTTPVPFPATAQFLSGGMQEEDASPDLGRTLWKMRIPSQPEGEGDLYRRESDGTFVHMGPLQPASVESLFGNEGNYLGASHDLTHVLIRKRPGQGRWAGDTTTGNYSLYEYGGTDEPEPLLVGVKNEGRLVSNTEAQLISQCETVLGSGLFGSAYNAISASGAIIYFTAHECGEPSVNELYGRVDEAHTVALSEPILPPGQCTGSCETAEHRPGFFAGASEDGSKVFFTTEQPLLNSDKDTTKDLYMAELEGARLKRLVMVSEGETAGPPNEDDPTPGEGSEVLGVARISEDGSHVYFVATGVLTQAANGQGKQPEPGADNLYLFDTSTQRTTFVATLSGEDEGIWQRNDNRRPVVATPDGRFLVFVSHADPLHEATAGSQVYKYDANSGDLRRVSLGQHSSTEAFAPKIVSAVFHGDHVVEAQSKLTMSDDGAYVFFESPDGLTPQAPDDQLAGCLHGAPEPGACSEDAYIHNVYEYHDGRVYLIASIRPFSEIGNVLLGTSHSGNDVFITTAAPLVAQDTDTQRDIYDARIGGGFPVPAQQVGCLGEVCQGPSSGSPQLTMPESVTLLGGNLLQSAPKPHVRSVSAAQRLARTLRVCRAKRARMQRRFCESNARKRFRAEIGRKSTRKAN